ncbi:hypothetical protein KNV09_gp187 [Vibrio phage Athena]|uniref:Coil containing protein n=7 Tax=Thalassavirus TaxID=2948922 RepID=A0A6M4ES91_9CAUD|nr:hypothetical protein FDJ20_gp196 [Vibrio phage Thalassa]YP_010101875.1 hypothetical protein KNU52_gp177 [Vibrio phage Achelous]YP_010102530.1 hypothetical protein KNU58_gp175 [Vibrio phage Brizo]YP_010105691.1 hypothetical protein KNU87_gp188 [Vibrio phage Bennett]YP_010108335.1 hypothetical protein KNV07_gp187 [Vibrio phage Cody]YP_010108723.1 hypothetical protein KNV09_gp187 [Vibrio phage Athena]YP_010114273.1 hypothetical protein KNV71_gp193 [Vibrio phage Gary]QIG66413.1 hypothetical p
MNPAEVKAKLDILDGELKDLTIKAKVLADKKRECENEKARLRVIQQSACDHPREARSSVMVNNEPEYFCTLCGKDF